MLAQIDKFVPQKILLAAIAQSVERTHGKGEVSGSIPDRGSSLISVQGAVAANQNQAMLTTFPKIASFLNNPKFRLSVLSAKFNPSK